jgi:acetoin utilization protein AcuC
MKNILIYSDKLASVEYSPTHPFKPSRARQMYDLLVRYSLIYENNQSIVEHKILDDEMLYLFHTRDYIETLKKCESGQLSPECLNYGLGTSDNPLFKGLFDFSMRASGGTFLGAELLINNEARFALNPIGGFHHAMRDRAGGFCYINDIVIAIKYMLQHVDRVAYIDIDVHHGDGVQNAFYDDNRVLTISIHESGHTLFPGTGFEQEIGEGGGFGYNINVPLMIHSDDEVYLKAYEEILPPVLTAYKPDILFVQIGGDAHRDDPLANLNITTNAYDKMVKSLNTLAPKILAAGGGGYNLFKTSAIWALCWAGFCGIKPHDHYAGVVGGMMYGPEADAGSLYDEPFLIRGHKKQQCIEYADEVISYIKQNVFPVHGIPG